MKKRLKIAFVAQPHEPVLPPSHFAVGTWIYEVARQLAHEHDVRVYASPQPEAAVPQDGVSYRFVRSYPDRLIDTIASPLLRGPGRPFFASSLFALGYYTRIAWDLRQQPRDIVHVMTYQNSLATLRLFDDSAKQVLHRHDNGVLELNPAAVRRQLDRAALIIGCSDFVVSGIRERFSDLAWKCHTVFDGVDTRRFTPLESRHERERVNLLYVGRLSPEKGVHELLAAFARLADERPNVHLTVLGPQAALSERFAEQLLSTTTDAPTRALAPIFRQDYRAYLDALVPGRLRQRITFRGAVAQSEIHACYQQADIFVFPAVGLEAFGMPVVEAMATGLPVVATRGGGVNETVVEGTTGLLVERADPDALHGALVHLVDHPRERLRLGANGRDRAAAMFSWVQVGRRLLELYDRFL